VTMDNVDPWDGVNASPTEMQAAAWCERRSESNWSEHDQAALDAWLALSHENTVAFLRMSHVWERADRLGALGRPLKPFLAANVERRRPFTIHRVVAVLVIVGAIGAAANFYVTRPAGEFFSTPIGGREVLTLADGSQVELNTDTALRIRVNGTERSVQLERGE